MEQFDATNIVEVNGVELHYAVVGEGRPVVLVHGNAEDHNLFTVEIEQLAEAGYRVYAPDSRGHGANEPLEEYHFDTCPRPYHRNDIPQEATEQMSPLRNIISMIWPRTCISLSELWDLRSPLSTDTVTAAS